MALDLNEIKESDCGQYVTVKRKGQDGYVQVKFDDEGVVVDIFNHDDDSIGTTFAPYNEMSESEDA